MRRITQFIISLLPGNKLGGSAAGSVSLARSSLRHEWRRYLAAVLAITFAGLLVMVQMALLLGLFGTVSVSVSMSGADLWIGYRNTQSVDLGRAIPRVSDTDAWIHPDVDKVERYMTGFGDFRRSDGTPVSVVFNAIDTRPGGLAFSKLLTREQRALLDEPDAIIIDKTDVQKLNATLGTLVEINGKRAWVVGIVEGIRAIGGANVLCSLSTARRFSPEARDAVTYYLIGLRPGANPKNVAKDLEDKGPIKRFSVWEADAFSVQSQLYWMFESGAGIGTAFASLLALVVGVVITNQTLAGAILAASKEYAALRALGVPKSALRAVVLEQSFWLGTIGLAVTGALTACTALLGNAAGIAMSYPLWMTASVMVIIYAIALLSGLMSLRPLMNTDPASLLR